MLEIKNLTVHYGRALALENMNVIVPDKGLTAIIGPNGAGKTTTLKTISRLINPTTGSITFNGQSILQFSPHKLAKMGIAHCPEGRKPFPEMSVMDNLLIGIRTQNLLLHKINLRYPCLISTTVPFSIVLSSKN